MSFFSKLLRKSQEKTQQKTQQTKRPDSHVEVMTMLAVADIALVNGEYSCAADTYKELLNVYHQNATAQYNLGRLYLYGKGVEQNPVVAAKLFRLAAEFGNDGDSQNSLAVLYNIGFGVEKNNLAALYWFDRAIDNGVEVAKKDQDGIFNAYRSINSPEELNSLMQTLSDYCKTGTADIPRDEKKAVYWLKKSRYRKKQKNLQKMSAVWILISWNCLLIGCLRHFILESRKQQF